MTASSGRSHRLAYVLIVLVGLAAHGLLLLSDVRVADDWMYLKWMENREWETFRYFHQFYNNVLQAIPLWPLSYFDNVISAAHIWSLVIIVLSGLVIYRICLAIRYFTKDESLLVAAFSLCYPAFMWHASAIYSVFYNLTVLAFYAALLLSLVSEKRIGFHRGLLQALSVLLYLYSFHTGSLLVFFYGAAVVHVYVIGLANSLGWKEAVRLYLTKRLHFFLGPLFFRGAYQLFGRPYIWNEPQFDLSMYVDGLQRFLATVLNQALAVFGDRILWLVFASFLFTFAGLKFRGSKSISEVLPEADRRPRRAAITLSFGLTLLLLGIFPYIAIGKPPYPGATVGYSTRTLLLAQVPVAIVLVSLLQFLASSSYSRLLIYPLAAGMIVSSVALQAKDALTWMYYGVLDRSFYANLKEMSEAREVSYFIVVDRAYYMATVHHPVVSIPFEIAQIFRGPNHVFADLVYDFDMRDAQTARKSLTDLIAEYSAGPVNLTDAWRLVVPAEYKQGVLLVCPGPEFNKRSRNRLVALYQYYRFLRPEELQQFLSPLLRLRLVSMSTSSRRELAIEPALSECER